MSEIFLEQPLQELDLSESFKEMAYNNGFKTIRQILHMPAGVLLMHEGFTYHHYEELRNLLIQHDVIHLLKTEPSQFA
jgi:hypothetical protein